ncbi:Protein MCM10 [Araneus ventricosus]|uniref:Protein MCM10 n=1 Tax=Araneus ventricosus TaxID=182803 RepID=A0A4Y2JB57_ARAVE|nr:Protein MCM10 [Araneus ventricosus]
MDNSEEMDLDSLMELLDDEPFEDETSVEQASTNTTENNLVAAKSDRTRPARLVLKDMFQEDFLTPKEVENPKKDTSFNKPSLKMFPLKESVVHTGETDDEDEESKEYLSKTGQSIKKVVEQRLSLSNLHSKPTKPSISTWTSKGKSKSDTNGAAKDSSFIVDSYSGIRVVNPLVSFSTLQQRMDGRRMIKMSFIHNFIKNGDIEGDWVTMGVIIQKVPPKTSANGKTYSIWKMSDLHDVEKPVSVFLFKTAHSELWKTAVGTVFGILNPSIMPKRDNRSELCLAVDQPGKCMMMGKSKDLGFCKSKRNDGTPCNVAVNIFQCEYCTFHIKKEYRKFSSKRSELQSCFSGREPSLKNKVLKGQNVFYGGQSFTAAVEKKSSSKLKTKDKLTLSNLGLKRKAEALESVEKEKSVKKLADLYGPDILKAAEKNSEYINEMLTVPTAGSQPFYI